MYMPGDCWFYVTVYMFNIKKKKKNTMVKQRKLYGFGTTKKSEFQSLI